MSKSSFNGGWRGRLAIGCLGIALAAPGTAAAAAKPYVEQAPSRGFHLILRPHAKTPEAQWQHVQALDVAGIPPAP